MGNKPYVGLLPMLVQNMGGNTTHSCFHLDPRSTFHFHLTKAFTQAESPRLNLFFRLSQVPTTNNIQGFTFTRATNHKKSCKQQNSCKQHNNYIVNLASPVWIGLRRQRWEQQSRLFLCSKHSEASVGFISLQLFLAGSKFQTQTHTQRHRHRDRDSDSSSINSHNNTAIPSLTTLQSMAPPTFCVMEQHYMGTLLVYKTIYVYWIQWLEQGCVDAWGQDGLGNTNIRVVRREEGQVRDEDWEAVQQHVHWGRVCDKLPTRPDLRRGRLPGWPDKSYAMRVAAWYFLNLRGSHCAGSRKGLSWDEFNKKDRLLLIRQQASHK